VRPLVLVLLVSVACSNGTKKHDDARPVPTQPEAAVETATAKVWLTGPQGEIPVTVEVVATRTKIMKGLMYREHLPIDAGMLFLMAIMNEGKEADHTFYMRNTLIPLDMIFINKDLTIVGIVENAVPRTETLRSVGKPSLYVLEVNGGWTAAKQIKPGTKVRFEGVTPSP
jgi:uncharacterized membrane protein (UPF0127 family)